MEKTLKFKSSMSCGGCVSKVKPFLDVLSTVKSWEVNTDDPQNILTVHYAGENEQEIIEAVAKAGHKLERLE